MIAMSADVRKHVKAIRRRCHEIDTVLGIMADREFPDDAAIIDTGSDNLQAIVRHAEALAVLATAEEGDGDWWGVAPRSVDYARRHPWEVIRCASREDAERVRDEQNDREHRVIVFIREVIISAE